MFKTSVRLFCFTLNFQLFDLFMGEPKTPHFYDFGISGRVPGPQSQLRFFITCFISSDTRILHKIQEHPHIILKHIFSIINLTLLDIQHFDSFRKGGHRQHNEDPLENLKTLGYVFHISSKNMTWKLGHM